MTRSIASWLANMLSGRNRTPQRQYRRHPGPRIAPELRGDCARLGHIGPGTAHRGDPTIVYVLSGVRTNHDDEGIAEDSHPGQVFPEFGPHS